MSSGEIVPGNPATLAGAANEQLFYDFVKWEDSDTPSDHDILMSLGRTAQDLEFPDTVYYVMANRALAIPDSIRGRAVGEAVIGNMYDLPFVGVFKQYAKVQIDNIDGYGGVQAYCLLFDEIVQASYPSETFEERSLFVPALAVREMEAM